jgi:hypothetical protein
MIHSDSHEWSAVVQGRRKWVSKFEPGKTEPVVRYAVDLAEDPGEKRRQGWDANALGAKRMVEHTSNAPPSPRSIDLTLAGFERKSEARPSRVRIERILVPDFRWAYTEVWNNGAARDTTMIEVTR